MICPRKWWVHKELGKGGAGTAYLAEDPVKLWSRNGLPRHLQL